jgi:hypothetical protein
MLFATFVMPMVLLAIRVEMEVILKMNYPSFMEDPTNEQITMQSVNGVITELLDPQIYYSRFSFLESGKDAIDIKSAMAVKRHVGVKKNQHYTRSALIKNLIPQPSDGRVRSLFTDNKQRVAESAKQQLYLSLTKAYGTQESQVITQKGGSQVLEGSPFQSIIMDETQKEGQMLDLINKVQMFQIAAAKANHSMVAKNKHPVFNLKFAESFKQGQPTLDSGIEDLMD